MKVVVEYVQEWDSYNVYVNDQRVILSEYVEPSVVKKIVSAMGAEFEYRKVETSDGI